MRCACRLKRPRAVRDLLRESLIEAHRNGLVNVAWFEYGFLAAQAGTMNQLQRQKPEWLSRDIHGSELARNGFACLNPLHRGARALLPDLELEAIDNYDIDGIQLDDRIVWPHVTLGYDEYTQQAYASEHGGARPPADYKGPAQRRAASALPGSPTDARPARQHGLRALKGRARALLGRRRQRLALVDDVNAHEAQCGAVRVARAVYFPRRNQEAFAGLDHARRFPIDQQFDFTFHHVADFVARMRVARRAGARLNFTAHHDCLASRCGHVGGQRRRALHLRERAAAGAQTG